MWICLLVQHLEEYGIDNKWCSHAVQSFFSSWLCCQQTTSKRLADRKISKFDKNILKRGAVPETTAKKGKDYPVGPFLLGFFIFVIIRTATSGGMA
ncbi:unnamed protein product [Linum tenue]|uniref:Stress-associated endoplasmic reticulum protein n=1 Tax=Linum tenue TaxID=586396 RepID=A0AAV0H7J3_9ROSI|nr:unnamed protein product [Linum tenue]